MSTIILTVLGSDRPGLTGALAQAVLAAGGNWLESHLTRLGGTYVGSVLVGIADTDLPVLREAVSGIDAALKVELVSAGHAAASGTPLTLNLVGQDRAGIVHEVSAALAALHVNIEELDSDIEATAWSGAPLFKARLSLLLPEGVTPAAVQDALEGVSGEIMVDLTLPIRR
ncbi:ACT domain-containing protein [Sandarakinorhabdus sp.]|uniref:glycine cleavage system protein R n=1 Tax=Sandarakinorhabdus sp. TaxID=1916663 RepID=UPI00286DB269|nr:ACT domain-containing protein [Sandarakinorhabdus sp.]